ncbi:hypothetical protein ANME2D_00282 [Candidatus Methanoperedens nitroreducens]|uniref:HEPN domain-containing protein n=1 Tax=Candidatus Methanoperedens nitratireducens TaxID=1392998 RepID=A0A062V7C9_9EURY|nr:HEPN domain-containing protein [Candidatus Methanoperedens nitroreducens]KCZ73222.1 hypothetical protein ANME2D_00282 [Candidatus Methanoperedens nitroreducens]MDJ1422830.1 HEPN domain-containing protein [Candidatus Methanoperedens sp.]
MKYQFEQCLGKGKVVKIERDHDLISKEINEAENDLKSSEMSMKEGNFKWAIIQAYYSMFHSFRALLFSKGYREKSHTCLKYAIESLFVDNGLLDNSLVQDFGYAMKMREGADYGYVYNEDSAQELINTANKIYEVANRLV